MKNYTNLFADIVSSENLFAAWDKFKIGKRSKIDVQKFEQGLETHIFQLQRNLQNKSYKHDPYTSFYIHDPKQRHIHKASVRDRVVHHAVYRVLLPIFEPRFISNSFSCRIDKGTHRGIRAFNKMTNQESKNYTRRCFVLKCDIRSFFESIDHDVLMRILEKKIKDADTLWLLREIVASHYSSRLSVFSYKGLPIGNLTSQLFANVYLNDFDQFIKQDLRIKHYARYTDDFVIVSQNKTYLESLIPKFEQFLRDNLGLELHPKKVTIRKIEKGVDFLGFVSLPHHRTLRTKTKKRMFRRIEAKVLEYNQGNLGKDNLEQSLQSYLGVLSHGNTYKLRQKLLNTYWFWRSNGS